MKTMDYVNQFARLLNSFRPRTYIFTRLFFSNERLSHYPLFSALTCASSQKSQRQERIKWRKNRKKKNKHFVSRNSLR